MKNDEPPLVVPPTDGNHTGARADLLTRSSSIGGKTRQSIFLSRLRLCCNVGRPLGDRREIVKLSLKVKMPGSLQKQKINLHVHL